MDVSIQGRAEPMDEGHRAAARLGIRSGAAGAQPPFDGIEENTQGAIDRSAVVFQVVAQPPGQGQDPLTHR